MATTSKLDFEFRGYLSDWTDLAGSESRTTLSRKGKAGNSALVAAFGFLAPQLKEDAPSLRSFEGRKVRLAASL